MKLIDLLAVSYLLSSLPPAASLSSSWTLYSSRLDLINATGILFSSTSYSSRRIVQLPTVPMRAALTQSSLIFSLRHICYRPCRGQPHCHPHRHRARRVASYYTNSHCPCECYAHNSRSSLIFSPCHICYRLCHRQPHRHLH